MPSTTDEWVTGSVCSQAERCPPWRLCSTALGAAAAACDDSIVNLSDLELAGITSLGVPMRVFLEEMTEVEH